MDVRVMKNNGRTKPRTTGLRPWLWGAALRGRREHSSRPSRAGRSVVRGKHVVVIAPTPFFADRGCHVRILEETRALIRMGYDLTICTYHIGRDMNGIEIRRTIKIPWYSKLSAGPSIHKIYCDLLLLCTVVRSCLKKSPDIIHAHLHEGVVIGKIASLLFGAPLVADLQGSLTDELVQHTFIKEGGIIFRLFRWAERIITRLPDATLVSSKRGLDSLPAEVRNNGGKAEVIMDGVDTDYFSPDCDSNSIREKLGSSWFRIGE